MWGEWGAPCPHTLRGPSGAPIKVQVTTAPYSAGTPAWRHSPRPPSSLMRGELQGRTWGGDRLAPYSAGSVLGRAVEARGRHLQLAAGPSWLAGVLAPPGSGQPSLSFPPPALLTNPQPRTERGPCRPNPSDQAPPSSSSTLRSWPLRSASCAQVPRVLLGRPAPQSEAHLRAYGRRGPACPGWSQGRCIWHLPWSRAGSWPRPPLSGTPASLLLGCRTQGGGAVRVMREGCPVTTVPLRIDLEGWVSFRVCWLGSQVLVPCTPLPRPRVKDPKVPGPGGSPSWLRPLWLGRSAHQQGAKDRLGRSAQRVFWPQWTSSHRAAWNSWGQSPVFGACGSQAAAHIHRLRHGSRGVVVGEAPCEASSHLVVPGYRGLSGPPQADHLVPGGS